MIKLNKETKVLLLDLYKKKNIILEGTILKLIESEDDSEFDQYLKFAIDSDIAARTKRLKITKQIQVQNTELKEAQEHNKKLMDDLQQALCDAQKAKDEAVKLRDAAVEDLDTLQKRTQFELIGMIVKVALYIIIGVGCITTFLYMLGLINHWDVKLLESTWSNMFGILLTNSFSIIGTIMGVKYAASTNKEEGN
jgi:uncharacterized membrane protein YkvA (DUF1232 family)